MKPAQFWSTVLGIVISLLVLAGYAYNISAYAATTAEKVWTLQRQREEDLENSKYIRQRVDEIYNILRGTSCGQCKDH